eukprot:gene4794-3438_t
MGGREWSGTISSQTFDIDLKMTAKSTKRARSFSTPSGGAKRTNPLANAWKNVGLALCFILPLDDRCAMSVTRTGETQSLEVSRFLPTSSLASSLHRSSGIIYLFIYLFRRTLSQCSCKIRSKKNSFTRVGETFSSLATRPFTDDAGKDSEVDSVMKMEELAQRCASLEGPQSMSAEQLESRFVALESVLQELLLRLPQAETEATVAPRVPSPAPLQDAQPPPQPTAFPAVSDPVVASVFVPACSFPITMIKEGLAGPSGQLWAGDPGSK